MGVESNPREEPGRLQILVVEDEASIAEPIEEVLKQEGHSVFIASDGNQAMRTLAARGFDLVISDIRLPYVDGMTIFRWLRREAPDVPVILMTAYGSISEAVAALHDNAFHYLPKPFEIDELLSVVKNVSERRVLFDAAHSSSAAEREPTIIGSSAQIVALNRQLDAIADSDANVLIHGESGTGKELVARAIHENSGRSSKPFVAINCAAFPDSLFDAELFGYERGAFTGATHSREGRFRHADGGTLFLDEVFEMAPSAQAKLLRALQEGTFQPLGSDDDVTVDVRVLAATNVDLSSGVSNGTFREDLFYRLKVLEICVPPLRERMSDLALLVGHFLATKVKGEELPSVSPRAWAALRQHSWPGNVRELEHAIEHAVVLSRGVEIDIEHLPQALQGDRPQAAPHVVSGDLHEAVAEFEKACILRALEDCGWNRSKTSESLGISRKNLWEKLKKHRVTE